MKPVVLSLAARLDLIEIEDYIAADNPAAAARTGDQILDLCESLGSRSRPGVRRPDLGRGLRMAVCRRYLVIYKVGHKSVTVYRIVHGSRNLTRLRL